MVAEVNTCHTVSKPMEVILVGKFVKETCRHSLRLPSLYHRTNTTFVFVSITLPILQCNSFITGPPNKPVLFCSLASVVCRRRL